MSEHTRTPRQSREFTRIHCPDRIVWIFFRDTHHSPSEPPLICRANPLVLSHPAGLLVYYPRPHPPSCTIPPHQLSHHPRDNRNFKLKGPIFVHLDAVCCVVGFTNPPACVAPRCTANPHPSLSQRAPAIPSFIAMRQSRRTNDCFSRRYARFVEPSFSRVSLSCLIIIIVGNKRGRCCTPVKRFTFARVIYFARIILFYFCLPLRVHESTRQVRFHDG